MLRILLYAYFLVGLLNLWAEHRQSEFLVFATKPCLLALLSLWFYLRMRPLKGPFPRFILSGLLFSIAGDSLLMLVGYGPKDERFFLMGLGAFLLAQLSYMAGFVRYPGSEMVFLSTFEGSSVWTRPETTASIRTQDSLNAVANYYQEVIRTSGWQVIQSRRTGEAALFMAESGYRNLLTVIIRPELYEDDKGSRDGQQDEVRSAPGADLPEPSTEVAGPTRIKLYLKQSNSD